MGKKTTKDISSKQTIDLGYAKSLESVGRSLPRQVMWIDEIRSGLLISDATQEKLITVVSIMDLIGKFPGDLPKTKFDQPITYHRLPSSGIEWLEKAGFHPKDITPLANNNYCDIFASKSGTIIGDAEIEKFFSHLIHCLLIETQIIISRQYYYGMGFYQPRIPVIDLPDTIPSEIREVFTNNQLNQIMFDQLHGKIFVDYCAAMIRAQWDKFVSLSCLVFGVKQSWDSIFDGIKALRQKCSELNSLHPACCYYLNAFLDMAVERLSVDGWLKNYRDSLLHGVGQHTLGVVPHKKTQLTTSELWDKICEEHNWVREGFMALIISFWSKTFVNTEKR